MSADAPNTFGRTPCTGLAPRVSPTTCRPCLPCMRPRRGRLRPAPPANASAYDHNRALLAACSPPGQRRVVALIALVTDARIRLPAPACVHVDVAADRICTGQHIHDEDNAPATPPPPNTTGQYRSTTTATRPAGRLLTHQIHLAGRPARSRQDSSAVAYPA